MGPVGFEKKVCLQTRHECECLNAILRTDKYAADGERPPLQMKNPPGEMQVKANWLWCAGPPHRRAGLGVCASHALNMSGQMSGVG